MYPYNVVFQDAGIVLTVKTHGHTVGKAVQMERQEQIKENHHKEVNHTAILLIRNPYKAIIGNVISPYYARQNLHYLVKNGH